MADFASEDEIRELLKSVYLPAAPSPEFKNQLLQNLTHRGGITPPLWKKPRLWVPIAASAISAVIGYGIWLGQTIGATLVP
jgi:hypothetical protein